MDNNLVSRSIGSQSSNLDFSSEKKVEFFGWTLFCLVKSPCGHPFEAFKREKIEPNTVCGCQSKTGSKPTCEDIKCLFVARLAGADCGFWATGNRAKVFDPTVFQTGARCWWGGGASTEPSSWRRSRRWRWRGGGGRRRKRRSHLWQRRGRLKTVLLLMPPSSHSLTTSY